MKVNNPILIKLKSLIVITGNVAIKNIGNTKFIINLKFLGNIISGKYVNENIKLIRF